MKQKNQILISILLATLLIITNLIVLADWDPDIDDHKMHYPQLPDEDGWDVYATVGLTGYSEICLADDWQCNATGPVSNIHFWGSWKNGIEGNILGFNIAIHADIPADPPQIPYSRPGTLLWMQNISDIITVPIDSDFYQGWYNPSTGEIIYDDHTDYYQYNIVDIVDPFIQEEGTIYWLRISAIVEEDPTGFQPLWGWKSSEDHWNDDACWADWYDLDWIDLWEPAETLVNSYWAAFDMAGMPIPGFMGGTDYFDDGMSLDGWYFYESGWWNIWFYDHPFDYDRIKIMETNLFVQPFEPGPAWIEIALNYATDIWSIEGIPDQPPLPGDFPPPEEDMYIERIMIYSGPVEGPMPLYFLYEILDYNPEWVSIDVMGSNIWIQDGILAHTCLGSLDLAFVIDGGCTPSIDVEKYVWDPNLMEYVDADDPGFAVDFTIGDIAEFKIAIHNDGECCNLTDITVYDFAEPSMEIVDFSIFPNHFEYIPGQGTEIWWWSLPEPLPPCNWINITIWAEVLGPHCSIDYNYIGVEAYCEGTGAYVSDEDYCYIHAVEPEELEYGDAPEDSIAYPSTMTIGAFPTCQCCGPAGFIRHNMFWEGLFFFGNMKDNEIDGNAGFCPSFPPYDQDEGFFPGPDGGLMAPDIYTIDGSMNVVLLAATGVPSLGFINQLAFWGGTIDMFVQNWAPIDVWVNVLADWNQNGQWGDPGEHVLINQPIPIGFNGPISLLMPPPIIIGSIPGYVWFRFSITEMPLIAEWDGAGEFEDGETEDYLLLIQGDNPPTACYTWADADGSGSGTTIDFDASCSTDDFGITMYEWDWTSDGSYDYTGGPTASHDYGDYNWHNCTLRVTDTGGFIDTFTDMVKAIVEMEDVNQSVQDRGFPIRHAIDGDWAAAQNFSTSVNTLSRVEIYLRKFGTPEFNLTVELRENHPQGTLHETLIFTPSAVPSSWTWFSIDFSDIAVTPTGDYFVVVPPAPSGVTTSFGYEWGYAFGNQYDPGSFWFTRDGGGLWRDLPTVYEFVFKTFGY